MRRMASLNNSAVPGSGGDVMVEGIAGECSTVQAEAGYSR
jgi:hypothetical protein